MVAVLVGTALVAVADTVQVNNVGPSDNSLTFTAGSSGTAKYSLRVGGSSPDAGGCNADGAHAVTVMLSVPAGLTATPSSFEHQGCGPGGAQTVTYGSSTAGVYTVTVSSVTGGKAGSTWNFAEASLKVTVDAADSTPPVIVASVSGTHGDNGWYVGPVTVGWTITDAESAVTSTSGCGDATFSSDGSHSQTCSATSAGGTSSSPVTVSIDASSPGVTATLSPAAADTGWYNVATGAPTVSFACSDEPADVASGVATCPPDHAFHEGADQGYTGTGTDVAGNTGSAAVNVDVDLTDPTISASVSPEAASTGWYNIATGAPTVSYTCGDTLSGVATCSGSSSFGDGSSQGTSGTAVDVAGNSASESVSGIGVDLTAPGISLDSRTPSNADGWNNGEVTVTWGCSDGGSGPVDAQVSQTVSGEGAGQVATGTCSDVAGNSASQDETGINIDLTQPTIRASVSPEAASTGWYNIATGAPTVSYTCDDALSGVATCPAAETVGEGADQGATGTALDEAGNAASASVEDLYVDLTAPAVSVPADISATATAKGGAYVSFTTSGSDPYLDTYSCDRDSGSLFAPGTTTVTCTARDEAGNAASKAFKVTVAYGRTGFLQPLSMTSMTEAKRGSTVPAKFQLNGASAGITDADDFRFRWEKTGETCVSGQGDGSSSASADSGKYFRFSESTTTYAQYIYNWKTPNGANDVGVYRVYADLPGGDAITTKVCLKL